MASKGVSEFRNNGEDFTINDPNIAVEFSTSESYSANQFVYHNGNLYRFRVDHAAGAWNGDEVQHIKLANYVADANTKVENVRKRISADAKFGVIDTIKSSGFEYENLFDLSANNHTDGYYDRTNTFVSSDTIGQTDYIIVSPGYKYFTNVSGASFVLWYDGSKNFLSYSDKAAGINSPVTAPTNAVYGKFIFVTATVESFAVYTQSVSVANLREAVLLSKAFEVSPNLLDKNDPDIVVDGYYDRYGELQEAEGYNQSGYIPVTPSKKYTSNVKNNFVIWCDDEKNVVDYTPWSDFNTNGYVVAPGGVKYGRFICQTTIAAYDVWQVVESDTLPDYMPYGTARPTDKIIDLDFGNQYNGKSGVAFGTSLTYRAQTTGGYLNYLPTLSGVSFDNQGIGNATILVTEDFPTLDILAKVKSYTGYASKQVCILEGFVNDWVRNHDKLGQYTDTAETTVCGCVRSAINYILTQNPDITLFLVIDHYGQTSCASTAKNNSNITQYEYYKEIEKVAQSMGVPVIPQFEISGMSEYTPDYFEDNIHLTMLGAEQSAKTIWGKMKQIYPKVTD